MQEMSKAKFTELAKLTNLTPTLSYKEREKKMPCCRRLVPCVSGASGTENTRVVAIAITFVT